MEGLPRRSAAVATSLLVHAALLALLLQRVFVKLDLAPTPIEITFVEAATKTAGPGELSPVLKSAAPAPAPPPPVQPEELRPEPEEIVEPVPVVVPRPKPVVKKVVPVRPPSAATSASAASESSTSAPAGEAGTGIDSLSSAPAWAPTARVRYEELLFAWMNRHKEYPMLAQRRGLQGGGVVRVRIDRQGRVLDRALVKGTGEAMLDQAALDMVRRSDPFPAVPDAYAGASFEFVAPIEYRLR
jgi:periplasmic protein TonB